MLIAHSNTFIFDFVTNQDMSAEMSDGPCTVVVDNEYCVVPYGTNLPATLGGSGKWINNYYALTDHRTYTMKPNLILKCKGDITRTHADSTVLYKLRLLQDGVLIKSREGTLIGSGETFSLSSTFQYPGTFYFTGVRIQDGSSYVAQIMFEEWYNNLPIFGTNWLSTSHNVHGRISPPFLFVGGIEDKNDAGVITTNKQAVNCYGVIDQTSDVALKYGLVYGYGSVGQKFSETGDDIIILDTDVKRFSFDVKAGEITKGRFALAAKNKYGAVTYAPYLQDYVFDFNKPLLKWKDLVKTGGNLDVSAFATDSESGIKSGTATFINDDTGQSVVGIEDAGVYSATLTLAEGSNTIKFTASDKAGNVQTIERVFQVDNSPPVITFETVKSLDATNTLLEMMFVSDMAVYDSSAIVKIKLFDNGSLLKHSTLTVNGNVKDFYYNMQEVGIIQESIVLQEGSNTIEVAASDNNDNLAYQTYSLEYIPLNLSYPIVEITFPENNGWLDTSAMLMTGKAYDNTDGIKTVNVSAALNEGGSPYTAADAALNGDNWEVALPGINYGKAYIVVKATNNSGRFTEKKWVVNTSNIRPSVFISPTPPFKTSDSRVTISSYAVEVASYLTRYVVRVNGITQFDVQLEGNLTNTQNNPQQRAVDLSVGSNNIEVIYYNASGLSAVANRPVERLSNGIIVTINPIAESDITSLPLNLTLNIESQIPLTYAMIDYIPNKLISDVDNNTQGIKLSDGAISGSVSSFSFPLSVGYVALNKILDSGDIPADNVVIRAIVNNQQTSNTIFFHYTMATTSNAPTITGFVPANFAVGVDKLAEVRVTFSTAMSVSETQNAFEFYPAVSGSWQWEQGNTIAVFSHVEAFSGSQRLNIAESAKGANGVFIDTSYSLNFSVNLPPGIESISPTGTSVSIESKIVIKFTCLMDELSLLAIILRNKTTSLEIDCERITDKQQLKSVVTLTPTSNLGFNTEYEILIPSSVKSVYDVRISEHRQSFTTREASGDNEEDGRTVFFTPGLNGFSFPVDVEGVNDEDSLRQYIGNKLFKPDAVGAIFRFNRSTNRWEFNLSGSSGRPFEFGEGFIINLSISTEQSVKFTGTPWSDSNRIEVVKGMNCIGLTRNVSGLTHAKDLISFLANQLNQAEMFSYLFRLRAGSARKTAVGYALKQPATHNGIQLNSGNESIAGDAIIFNSSVAGFLSLHGEDWKD